MKLGLLPVALLSVLLLAGCASNIPKTISTPPSGNPMVAEVRSDVQRFTGAHVRWGGTIATLENQANETWIEIIARELDRSGQPRLTDRTSGRFIAIIDGFLDPALFTEGRELTVAGVMEGETTRKIGEYDYNFPLVRVDNYLLWPLRPDPSTYDYPPYWYYDPWYPGYPWYPYYYPYRHYYPHRYYKSPPAKKQE
jgi:outer membrane lipoprotein